MEEREKATADRGEETPSRKRGEKTLPLSLAALGVVFGDIGTSPLYTIRECFYGLHAVPLTPTNVLGVLSLIFWSLSAVVSFKYVVFVLRADNRGEGGVFALFGRVAPHSSRVALLGMAAMLGASLLYGDGIITPAISVLAAVEGIQVATASMGPVVLPATVVILFLLFWIQRRGTGRVGLIFGPFMVLWFAVLAALGVKAIWQNPGVLAALDPRYALRFFLANGFQGFLALGAVVLCLTGAEALYADLGHFGRRPIRLAWFTLAFPALLLNYAGQAAVLLAEGSAATNPFYALVPRVLLYPVVALATVAAIIASQALISGAFSLTRQAIQFGYLPRLHIVHTSEEQEGQIYVPWVNGFLATACIGLVLVFRESTNLAAAYGVAVTLNMTLTSLLFFLFIRKCWRWSLPRALAVVAFFLVFDVSYFLANLFKFVEGGWFPIGVALLLVAVMSTWHDGRVALAKHREESTLPLGLFVEDIRRHRPQRVPGTAVFLSAARKGTPPALLHHFKHNRILHEQVVIFSVVVAHWPYVAPSQRVELESLGEGIFRLRAHFGFMEAPNVPRALQLAAAQGLETEPATTSYFLSRETLIFDGGRGLSRWRKHLFQILSRNAAPPTAYFHLPPGRVVELGMQVEI